MNLFPIDVHTHFGAPLVAGHRIINGTSPSDWEKIAEMATQYPAEVIPAFGLHPWFLKELPGNWERILREYLDRFPRALVGETGMDRLRRPPIPLEIQEAFFVTQWNLARELKRSVVIHSVKAWARLLPLLDTPARPFLCHAFAGPLEYLPALSDKGAYFSLGPREINRKNAIDLITHVPEDKLLLESDGTTLEEFACAVSSIAEILHISPPELLAVTTANARNFLPDHSL